MKNAAESMKERGLSEDNQKGIIAVKLNTDKHITLIISDNGKGFPTELLNRLTEPYVTTREKGTGLGLAIVKKIIDDHAGSLDFSNIYNEEGKIIGAQVKIVFLV